ncbi:MAG: hypothetical protein Q7S12_04570 [bacterium]|nr:hypothetical protein [bacterium]
MRFIFGCLLLALVIFPSVGRAQSAYEMTFVASVEELEAALKQGEALRGLAVRSEFYEASNQATKKKIDNLVESIQNSLRPVFIYGPDTRLEILEVWYPTVKGYFKCKATMAAVFSTIPIDEQLTAEVVEAAGGWTGANFLICDPYDGVQSEKDFRDRIDAFWREERQSLKNEGWATLN